MGSSQIGNFKAPYMIVRQIPYYIFARALKSRSFKRNLLVVDKNEFDSDLKITTLADNLTLTSCLVSGGSHFSWSL